MRRNLLIAILLALGGCQFDRSLGLDDSDGGMGDSGLPAWTEVVNTQGNKVDVLLMMDNSNSIEAMQNEFIQRIPVLSKIYSSLAASGSAADLHIGVVTSDYGAGATGAPGCQISPGGQQGKLQAIGAASPLTCKPPVGANFLHYNFADPMDNNLPGGQDFETTLGCMAAVGGSGCGYEHVLESVYAALHNNLPENQGFLRDDALLMVFFLTNEDDSSAPPDTDLFDKNKSAQYGYEDSYRSTRFGIVCGGAPGTAPPYDTSNGPLMGCRPAPNVNGMGPGKEYDVSRYINFFTQPIVAGGVKNDPNQVILIALDAPSDPFEVILSNPGTAGGTPYATCQQIFEQGNPPCVPVLQHSCQNMAQPVFFGDPAVRINAVVGAAPNHAISSVCDADYTNAIENFGNLTFRFMGAGCLPYAIADPSAPNCVVEDVTMNLDGSTTISPPLPACAHEYPCWRLETKPNCSSFPQSLGITVDRAGMGAPANTTTRFYCM
jgi:hypothetical protein